jgi:multidrug resistance efflux pump
MNVAVDSLNYALTQEQTNLAAYQQIVNDLTAQLATANANLATSQANIAQYQAAIATVQPVAVQAPSS